ncbi:MAG TPA: DUF4168 domain-containing protein [Pseudomonas sabulinigri]|uniref:DUF4168 domain-containing protein n=1 Tax=marine sediment metagenome TaxID=412755 RepID=A0A0F9YEY9_9ZZZZ|nr:DUF4168 domain-containing protein [Halopseudomonas sabulinigri]HEC52635.1 DUF4168 domain-containing protein [Halopseudomonas sabulinigri]|tara:strand:- start:1803 stop:2195 length:393 start_codon:yes stop_codon:yes gene_type:complete
MMNIKKFSAALIIATMTAGVPVAMAQSMDGATQQQFGEPQGAAQASAPVSETDLEKFVGAEKKVNEIREDLTKELSSAGDQQEAQKLQMGAQKEMVEAIQDQELDIPRYNEIASRMQTDMELRERAQQFN